MRRVEERGIWRSGKLLLATSLFLLASCAQFVQYTDEIVDRRTGRDLIVTAPAAAGGFCGFLVGLPVDIVALPVTFLVYTIQKNQNELKADPVSTLLFPSFVLWRTGTLVAIPMDMLHFVFIRAGQPDRTPTEEEQNEIEFDFDLDTLPDYPVEAIYPPPAS